MMSVSIRPKYGIIGGGRAAHILAPKLASLCTEVSLWARDNEQTADLIDHGVSIARDRADLLLRCDTLLLAVSDDAIPTLAHELAELWPRENGPLTAFHLAGALSSDELSALRERTCAVGVFHPIATLHETMPSVIRVSVSGDPAARQAGHGLARLLGWTSLEIEDAQRPAFHLAATLAANDVLALLKSAETLALEAGLCANEARSLVTDLARGSIDAYAQAGEHCLTGPASRGDLGTLSEHFRAIEDMDEKEEFSALHRLATTACARIAHRLGRIDDEALKRIIRLCR